MRKGHRSENKATNMTSQIKPILETGFQPAHLVDVLRWRAINQPDRLAYTFITDGETEEARLTYQQLDQRSQAIAAWLQSVSEPGERVLILYPPGLDYLAGFFGCLYACVVPYDPGKTVVTGY